MCDVPLWRPPEEILFGRVDLGRREGSAAGSEAGARLRCTQLWATAKRFCEVVPSPPATAAARVAAALDQGEDSVAARAADAAERLFGPCISDGAGAAAAGVILAACSERFRDAAWASLSPGIYTPTPGRCAFLGALAAGPLAAAADAALPPEALAAALDEATCDGLAALAEARRAAGRPASQARAAGAEIASPSLETRLFSCGARTMAPAASSKFGPRRRLRSGSASTARVVVETLRAGRPRRGRGPAPRARPGAGAAGRRGRRHGRRGRRRD